MIPDNKYEIIFSNTLEYVNNIANKYLDLENC